ncbi:MAG: HAMP domain-containing histidine kinase [Ktedonobacterales bacterium]|nr:HAMP domain-containing histidine kinase [Ktedonobacterales bacterium]
MAAETTPSVAQGEREIYRGYDRQRRLDLARGIAPIFAALLLIFLVLLDSVVPHLSRPSLRYDAARTLATQLIGDPVLLVCIIAFLYATVAVRRKQVGRATVLIIVATNVAVITIIFMWAFGIGGLDFVSTGAFAALCVAIALAGILGERPILLATTLLMNATVVFLGFFAVTPKPASVSDTSIADLADSQKVILIAGALLVQWAVTAIVLAATNTYERIMRELGDVRVAFERAQQLDDLKDQFISNVNHELRGPVMAMQGYLELLEIANETAPLAKRQSLLQRAAASADNLVALLNSILGTRQMDRAANDFVPESVDIRAAIEIAAGLLDPREVAERERALRIAVSPGLAIWGEQVRLQQIMTNLLSNAIKYSTPGSPIEVAATVITQPEKKTGAFGRTVLVTHQMADITVRDHGLGIPPEQAPLLFGRFVRLPRDLASTTVGNGLGLHLCRTLTEAMGGRIWVESSGVDGEGSTFHVVLPMTHD